MNNYTIATDEPSPSLQQTKVRIEAQDYGDAVQQAIQSWRETKRGTTLHSGRHSTYYWHMIAANGEFKDRNTNSGVESFGAY